MHILTILIKLGLDLWYQAVDLVERQFTLTSQGTVLKSPWPTFLVVITSWKGGTEVCSAMTHPPFRTFLNLVIGE